MGLAIFLAGLIGIWFGAHLAVDQALRIAKSLKISKLFIGLTILSIGTSLPEIFTHVFASLNELKGIAASNIAIGTNIGSNIFQITFIIGLLGILTTIKSSPKIQKRDGVVMIGSIILLFLFAYNGVITQLEGLILFALYLFYLYKLYTKEEDLSEIMNHHFSPNKIKGVLRHFALLAIGIFILALSANWVVNSTLQFSQNLGIEQSFFGLLIIGIATGLPEFTTAIMGILKKAKKISLGVLIGSNITNPMMAMGIGAMITDNPVSKTITNFDIPFWFVVSVILLMLFQKNKKLGKVGVSAMIISYFAYLLYKINSVGIINF